MTQDVTGTAGLAATALEEAGDAVITTDASGTITSWNKHAEGLLGHPASAALGRSLALIVPEQHRARHVAGFRRAVATGVLAHEGAPARIEALTAGGDLVPLVMTLGLLPATLAGSVGAVAVLRRADADPVIFVGPSVAGA